MTRTIQDKISAYWLRCEQWWSFRRVTSPYGSPLAPQHLDRWAGIARQFLDAIVAADPGNSRDDGPLRLQAVHDSVVFGFIENAAVNGQAAPFGRHNVVALFAGAPYTLGECFREAVRCEGTFQGLTTPKIDPQAPNRLRAVFAGQAPPQPLERAEEEAGLDIELFVPAIVFVLQHELSHVVLGHLDLLKARGLDHGLLEAEGSGVRAADDARLSHLLELDADRFAILNTLQLLYSWDKSWETSQLADNDPVSNLRKVLVATGLVFLLFDRRRLPLQARTERSHPHPAVRFARIYNDAAMYLIEQHGAPRKCCLDAMELALNDLARIEAVLDLDMVATTKYEMPWIEDELIALAALEIQTELDAARAALWRRIPSRHRGRSA